MDTGEPGDHKVIENSFYTDFNDIPDANLRIFSQTLPPEAQVQPAAIQFLKKERRGQKFKEFIRRKKEKNAAAVAQKRLATEAGFEDTQQLQQQSEDGGTASTMNPAKQKRSRIAAILTSTDATKTSLMKLNETAIPYTCDVTSSSVGRFQATLVIEGSTFAGYASTKQVAKQEAATLALDFIAKRLQLPTDAISAMQATKMQLQQKFPASDTVAEQPGVQQQSQVVKSPLQIVNEIFGKAVSFSNEVELNKAPEYLISMVPVQHSRLFSCTINLGDDYGSFEGTGQSKQAARQSAAARAMCALLKIESLNLCTPLEAEEKLKQLHDQVTIAKLPATEPKKIIPVAAAANPFTGGAILRPPTFATNVKTPLMLLNEKLGASRLAFEKVSEEGPPHAKVFTMKLVITGTGEFFGTGSSIKDAKQNAAHLAMGAVKLPEAIAPPSVGQFAPQPTIFLDVQQKLQHQRLVESAGVQAGWPDYVQKLVESKFELLIPSTTQWARRKVLAGIVMTNQEDWIASAQLICLATGTKIINADKLSLNGTNLIDCHAEILCRRSLLRYFYSHLLAMNEPTLSDSTVFEPVSGPGLRPFKLKPGIHFHLYISTAPCGDGRVFSVTEQMAAGDVMSEQISDGHPERENRGLLRTKVEAGEGTIPCIEPITQTYDGLRGGDRLVVMSCSDKLLTWNHLGVQGNLLGQFVEPIFLQSITIASLYNGDHLRRALYSRLPVAADFQPASPPVLLPTSMQERRTPSKAPNHSLLWSICDNNFEIIDVPTGMVLLGAQGQATFTSVVSKQALFKLYLRCMNNLKSQSLENLAYIDAKKLNNTYVDAKIRIQNLCTTEDLGFWPRKPVELEQFRVAIAPVGATGSDFGGGNGSATS